MPLPKLLKRKKRSPKHAHRAYRRKDKEYLVPVYLSNEEQKEIWYEFRLLMLKVGYSEGDALIRLVHQWYEKNPNTAREHKFEVVETGEVIDFLQRKFKEPITPELLQFLRNNYLNERKDYYVAVYDKCKRYYYRLENMIDVVEEYFEYRDFVEQYKKEHGGLPANFRFRLMDDKDPIYIDVE